MSNPPLYKNSSAAELTLRDELAIDRTVLANERTMLAYVRTALGFLVLGISFLHFLATLYFHIAGYAFMVLAVVVLIVGLGRYFKLRHDITAIRRRNA